ncbi:MAG: hypothetical protein P0107_04585 [Nitrosomonas sp.]|nr:hypothetical protein [Nitrosomonas sp.]
MCDRRVALVPLVPLALLARCQTLSGLSVEADVRFGETGFAEGLLYSPGIRQRHLQISSYWEEGERCDQCGTRYRCATFKTK